MKYSHLDNLPENVQRAIYSRFKRANIKDKIIFVSRLEYGSDLSYRELADKVGVSVQRIQYVVDNMMQDVKNSVLAASGYVSGVYL